MLIQKSFLTAYPAGQSLVPDVYRLWQEAFGDSREEIDKILSCMSAKEEYFTPGPHLSSSVISPYLTYPEEKILTHSGIDRVFTYNYRGETAAVACIFNIALNTASHAPLQSSNDCTNDNRAGNICPNDNLISDSHLGNIRSNNSFNSGSHSNNSCVSDSHSGNIRLNDSFSSDSHSGNIRPNDTCTANSRAYNIRLNNVRSSDISMCRGAYLYAVTVDKRLRRRGIMRAMLEEIKTALCGSVDFITLIPARKEYFEMYEKLGFTKASGGCFSLTDRSLYIDRTVYDKLETVPYDGNEELAYSLHVLTALSQNAFLKPEKMFRSNLKNSESVYVISENTPIGHLILGTKSKERINIHETSCPNSIVGDIINKNLRISRAAPKALSCIISKDLYIPETLFCDGMWER